VRFKLNMACSDQPGGVEEGEYLVGALVNGGSGKTHTE
jgi:hypothetical protein